MLLVKATAGRLVRLSNKGLWQSQSKTSSLYQSAMAPNPITDEPHCLDVDVLLTWGGFSSMLSQKWLPYSASLSATSYKIFY